MERSNQTRAMARFVALLACCALVACGDDALPADAWPDDTTASGDALRDAAEDSFSDANETDAPAVLALEPGELRPGGDTTTAAVDESAFVQEAANLSILHRSGVEAGVQFFRLVWEVAPGRSEADGLGPTYNATSCIACHLANGRGAHPEEVVTSPSVLLRLGDADGLPDPSYGNQLQPLAIAGVMGEGIVTRRSVASPWTSRSGERFERTRDVYEVAGSPRGALGAGVGVSPRMTPQLVGLGLLEAIPVSVLESYADPQDDDDDGISGRIARLEDGSVGRFGWKAATATVIDQSAAAFANDLGITSPLEPADSCSASDAACVGAPHGGNPEINGPRLAFVADYLSLLGVPARRNAEDPTILRGKLLFTQVGCAQCHVPSVVTGDSDTAELSGQLIWPYTDLLLHDMGEELSEGVPEGDASAQEWRTPPLWGVGLLEEVGGSQHLMHDGRARGVGEAILWHGGEGSASRAAYSELSSEDRQALVEFVDSL